MTLRRGSVEAFSTKLALGVSHGCETHPPMQQSNLAWSRCYPALQHAHHGPQSQLVSMGLRPGAWAASDPKKDKEPMGWTRRISTSRVPQINTSKVIGYLYSTGLKCKSGLAGAVLAQASRCSTTALGGPIVNPCTGSVGCPMAANSPAA